MLVIPWEKKPTHEQREKTWSKYTVLSTAAAAEDLNWDKSQDTAALLRCWLLQYNSYSLTWTAFALQRWIFIFWNAIVQIKSILLSPGCQMSAFHFKFSFFFEEKNLSTGIYLVAHKMLSLWILRVVSPQPLYNGNSFGFDFLQGNLLISQISWRSKC